MNHHQAGREHLTTFFAGHPCTDHRLERGPMARDPDFRVLRFGPGPQSGLWIYASVGASASLPGAEPLEFFILSPFPDDRITELITMTAHYHRSEELGLRHTLPIGGPWLRDSVCDCLFVSLPYPFGPRLERLETPDGEVRFLWLLPITSAERRFARGHGPEALEERFDEAGLHYWDPARRSVVQG